MPTPLHAAFGPTTPDHSATDQRPVLVVLGAGDEDYRSHLLQQISATHSVLLLDPEPPAWAWPYVDGAWGIDLHDEIAVMAALSHLVEHRGVVGVMTYLEHHVLQAAHLAETFGLPGIGTDAAAACRDKALQRTLLQDANVPSAASYVAETEQSAVDFAELLGYPVVVKPRAMAGGAGVRRADSPEAVRSAYHAARHATVLGLDEYARPGVLVEEYLAGSEISLECVVGDGDVQVVAITRKTSGPPPAFDEIGHLVAADDPLLLDSTVITTAVRALEALAFGNGVAHVELRRTPQGPRIVEVNGRLAGDLIPLLVQLATGVSLPAAAAALAMGQTPDLTQTRDRAAAVQFLYPTSNGILTRLHRRDATWPWLARFRWGPWCVEDRVLAPPYATIADRLAHWVVTGRNSWVCASRLQLFASTVTVAVSPMQTSLSTACVR
ncbi:acetyl-CoA carboxylase biotin carboxylase subunit family protein [Streptomyces noursei]|uniref:ATP-grasp domain-containing protein n=1 Tax=Streptomyces noursei TaxID=1971 RepID=UPI003830C44C